MLVPLEWQQSIYKSCLLREIDVDISGLNMHQGITVSFGPMKLPLALPSYSSMTDQVARSRSERVS